MSKFAPYKVKVICAATKQTRMIPAKTKAEAMAIAKHHEDEHGLKTELFKWNVDDQRYLRMGSR